MTKTSPAPESPAPHRALRQRRADGADCSSLYYELVELGVEEKVGADHLSGVWREGAFFPLGKVDG